MLLEPDRFRQTPVAAPERTERPPPKGKATNASEGAPEGDTSGRAPERDTPERAPAR